MSNFEYLIHLNTLAGRTYNDLTQYPVFPWILSDYTSEEIDLQDPTVYRDLSKPMGAQSEERRQKFLQRYNECDDAEVPPFHYGTHYSSSAAVLYYLIRTAPFTEQYMKLQGGKFDIADRLFSSMAESWVSASQESMTDVKELTPEFFYLPSCLLNINGLDLGTRQPLPGCDAGRVVNHVELPPWANGDPWRFIRIQRQALESRHVSENLHKWIDLIFGFKQTGAAAIDASNIFYYLTYAGAVDVEGIADPVQKTSVIAQINNFGQTPQQLFTHTHPRRQVTDPPCRTVPAACEKLRGSHVRKMAGPVGHMRIVGDKLVVVGSKCHLVSLDYYMAFTTPDCSLRTICVEGDRLLSVHESVHDAAITCAVATDDLKVLVTGGDDTVVKVWKFLRTERTAELCLQQQLPGHACKITCIDVSRAWSLAVSGAQDGRAIVWDINRLCFVRQLKHHTVPLVAVAVNHTSGDLYTASAQGVWCYSINGVPMSFVPSVPGSPISALITSHSPEWLDSNIVITGHTDGTIRCWGQAPAEPSPQSRSRLHSGGNASVLLGMSADGATLGSRLDHRWMNSTTNGDESPGSAKRSAVLADVASTDTQNVQGSNKLSLHRTSSENNITHRPSLSISTPTSMRSSVSSVLDEDAAEAQGPTQESVLATGDRDRIKVTAETASVEALSLRCELKGHEAMITCLYLTDDERRLLSSDKSGSIWSWAVD